MVVVVGRWARGADEAISPKIIQPRTMPIMPHSFFCFLRGLMATKIGPVYFVQVKILKYVRVLSL